jgi:hypothetical protein
MLHDTDLRKMRGWPVSDALGALNVMGPTLEEMLLEEDARIQMQLSEESGERRASALQELQAEISEMKISDLELVAERLKSSWYEDVRPGLEPGEHLQAIYLELEIRRLL